MVSKSIRLSPRVSISRALILTGATLAIALTAGCGGRGGKPKDTAYVARDVDSLYLEARRRLDTGEDKVAAALFDEVERQHPYSPWARRAQLMSAFSYYSAKDYTKSVQSAQRFLSIHPGNKDAAYAYYLIALCYYEQISDVSRDQKTTQQALAALNDVVRRYPGTRYATIWPARKWTLAAFTSGLAVGWPPISVSAMWWINFRPPAIRPRLCSVWWKPICRSASPRKRRNMPRCWGPIIRAANGMKRLSA